MERLRSQVSAVGLVSQGSVKAAREAFAKSASLGVPQIDFSKVIGDMPKVDLSKLIAPIQRVDFKLPPPSPRPLVEHSLRMPIRSAEEIRLEAIVDAVNRLIDITERQNAVLVALDSAMETRHAASERHADERFEHSDRT